MPDSLLRIAVPQGQRVFDQGDAADCAYIIETGRVAVTVTRDGAEVQIAERGPGDLFGEMAIIDNRTRSASIVALEDCVLLKLTASQLAHRLDAADPVIRLVLDVILTRLRATIAEPGEDTVAGTPPADHRATALSQIRLERELEIAIQQGDFELHFQPIVDLKDGATAGFEALIRWRHRERGLVPPNAFIPAAEASGLIIPMSEWCLRQACRSVRRFRQALSSDRPLFVSVNVSGIDLQRPDFFETYKRILEEASTHPADIKLEVTEGVLMNDPERAIATLKACRALGSTVALDDFGTGYSSMSYLSRFPIDTLKIDRSFARALETDRAGRNIVNAIVALGRGLGVPTVAEGIETARDAATLHAIGCAFGQGYHFSKPVPESDAFVFLQPDQRLAHRVNSSGDSAA